VFYLIPLVLSFSLLQPWLPVVLAGLGTVLIGVGFFLSPSGVIAASVVATNRIFGVMTLMLVAYVGRMFIESKLALLKEEWLRVGQNEVAETIRGEHSLSRLGELALQTLCRYLGAEAGVIYAVNGNGIFKRIALYGLSENDAPIPQVIRLGEGKVGLAAQEARILHLTNIPDSYLRLSSALGSAPLRSIVIAPMMAEAKVNAMVEFGFNRAIKESEQELLKLVAETIGITIQSAQNRTKLQELLEETQRQAEELQSQQEELKVTNEELQEQTRALKESQTKLETQQSELEETNQQLEGQAQTLEQQIDTVEARNQELNLTRLELERRARELAEASRYKSEFLANMSHELRTPLNSSLILAKLLADNPGETLTDEQVKFAQTIYSSGNDLLGLINDVLDLSKVEAGKLEIHAQDFSVAKMTQGLRDTFTPLARQKGVGLEVKFAPGYPDTLHSDQQRVEQILRNLLSNAMKFTEQGQVELKVSTGEVSGTVRFDVTDTGIGIAENQQQVIFEAFRQADGTTNRKYGGTGLGLSISRDLARLLGGEIQLKSSPESGSAFSLLLPAHLKSNPLQAVPAQATSASSVATQIHSSNPQASQADPEKIESKIALFVPDDRDHLTPGDRKILVIEDEAPFAKILYDLCREAGFKCLVAGNAKEGLGLARRLEPEAILLDMILPDQSGLSVLDLLKENPVTRHIPVAVVSAKDYAQTARQLGAVQYVLKPVKREELKLLFSRIEKRLKQSVQRVLVVEDDTVQSESIRALLSQSGVEIKPALTGSSALAELKQGSFDCVVMDLSLPDMSGYDLLQKLVQEGVSPIPPVVIYTGRSLTRDEERELLKYSRAIVIKGARSPERLFDEVSLFLHRAESKMSLAHQKMLKAVRQRVKAFEGKKILLVDDDVRNIFALSSALEQRGAVIEIARNGREAIEKLERDPSGIELVLMDIMMPEMDGYEAMRLIRKQTRFARLPIIAVTAKAMRDDHERCLEAGANDYLAKPVDIEKLVSLIRVWLSPLTGA